MASTLLDTKHETFEAVLGVAPNLIETAILNQQTAGESSLDEVLAKLADLFGVKKRDALTILGISRSRKSKNPTMNVVLLDRTYSALEVFSRITRILGREAAKQWIRTPKEALDGATPLAMLETRVGLRKLQDMLTALEDGAYL